MKKFFILVLSIVCLYGCTVSPNIEDLQERTASTVEELIREDNNEEVSIRLDKYFLSEQIDDLTYKGFIKATAFIKTASFDWDKNKIVDTRDSLKFYRPVIIKFRDKKYDYYTISIQSEEQ